MTRTARGNITTHQKVAQEPTPWEELKATPEKAPNITKSNATVDDPAKVKKRKFKEGSEYKVKKEASEDHPAAVKTEPIEEVSNAETPKAKKRKSKNKDKLEDCQSEQTQEAASNSETPEVKQRKYKKGKGGDREKNCRSDEQNTNNTQTPASEPMSENPENTNSDIGIEPNAEKHSKRSRKSHNKNVKGEGEGKVVKIFGSFWVPADDARRLQGLTKKLKAQGMSRNAIFEALKSERRKAEKSAKRTRDKACFSCREFGHVLRDCPNNKGAEIGQPESGEQICFKCGSTEHSSRACKKKVREIIIFMLTFIMFSLLAFPCKFFSNT